LEDRRTVDCFLGYIYSIKSCIPESELDHLGWAEALRSPAVPGEDILAEEAVGIRPVADIRIPGSAGMGVAARMDTVNTVVDVRNLHQPEEAEQGDCILVEMVV